MEKLNIILGDIIYYLFNKGNKHNNHYNNTKFTASFDFFTPDIYRISDVLTGRIFILWIVYINERYRD